MPAGVVSGWVFFALHTVFYTPFMCYAWYRLYLERESFIMKKRRTDLLLAERVLVILLVSVLMPIQFTFTMYRLEWPRRIMNLVITSLYSFGLWLAVLRIWLFYFDLQLRDATTKYEWSALITSNDTTFKSTTENSMILSDDPFSARHGSETFDIIPPPPLSQNNNAGMILNEINAAGKEDGTPPLEIEQLAPAAVQVKVHDRQKDSKKNSNHSMTFGANDSFTSAEENWFVQHWNTLGKTRYLLRMSFYVAIVFIVIDLVWSISVWATGSDPTLLEVSPLLIIFVLNLAPLIMYCKVPAVSDFIYLRVEVKYTVAIKTGGTFCLIVAAFIASGMTGIVGQSIISFVLSDLITASDSYMSCLWIPGKLKKKGVINGDSMNGTPIPMRKSTDMSNMNGLHRRPSVLGNQNRDKAKEILASLLSDDAGFKLFMEHLMNEFSMECLVSVIEFVQFKKLLSKYMMDIRCAELNSDNNSNDASVDPNLQPFNCQARLMLLTFSEFHFPKSVPLSAIVRDFRLEFGRLNPKPIAMEIVKTSSKSGTNDTVSVDSSVTAASLPIESASADPKASLDANDRHMVGLIQVAAQLQHKFLSDDSVLQINVSHQIRESVHFTLAATRFDEQSVLIHTLFHLFDSCTNQMMKLMSQSLWRFTETVQFEKWAKTTHPEYLVDVAIAD